MATPTGAAKTALEKKAKAEDNKSEGLRMLLGAGYTVTEAKDTLGVPYGFAYGVAKRAGLVEAAAARRPTKAAAAPAKAKAPAAKAKAPAKAKTSKVAAAAARAPRAPRRAAKAKA